MRHIQGFVFVVVGAVVAPGLAHAQATEEASATATAEPDAKIWLGGHVGVSPVGTIKAEVLDMTVENDTEVAFEIGAHFDYRVMPFLSVGLAPAVILNIKGENATDSASQLDLPLRIAGGANVFPKLRLYGFAQPGYSILFPPSDDSGETRHPSGFMIGFGAGAGFHVAPRLAITGEIGYHLRFLSDSEQGVELTFQDNYLTFSLGIAAGL